MSLILVQLLPDTVRMLCGASPMPTAACIMVALSVVLVVRQSAVLFDDMVGPLTIVAFGSLTAAARNACACESREACVLVVVIALVTASAVASVAC